MNMNKTIYAFARRARRTLALSLVVVAAAACRDDDPTGLSLEAPASIVVSPATLQLASLSDTASVSVQVLGTSGQALDAIPLIWTLEGEPTLQAIGSATGSSSSWQAVANGRSTLRVSVDPAAGYGVAVQGLSASAQVEVRQVATTLELAEERIELWSIGETRELTATARDARQNPIEFLADSIMWSVDDAAVARIEGRGQLMALSDGEATLNARLGGLTGSAAIAVESAIVIEGCFNIGGQPRAEGCLTTRLRLTEKN